MKILKKTLWTVAEVMLKSIEVIAIIALVYLLVKFGIEIHNILNDPVYNLMGINDIFDILELFIETIETEGFSSFSKYLF